MIKKAAETNGSMVAKLKEAEDTKAQLAAEMAKVKAEVEQLRTRPPAGTAAPSPAEKRVQLLTAAKAFAATMGKMYNTRDMPEKVKRVIEMTSQFDKIPDGDVDRNLEYIDMAVAAGEEGCAFAKKCVELAEENKRQRDAYEKLTLGIIDQHATQQRAAKALMDELDRRGADFTSKVDLSPPAKRQEPAAPAAVALPPVEPVVPASAPAGSVTIGGIPTDFYRMLVGGTR
jgi:hypothetical protein